MEKRVRVTLDNGFTQEHGLDWRDDNEFGDWLVKVMTNLTRERRGWFILDGPYAWYRVEHIIAFTFVDNPPPDRREPIGFKAA